MVKNLPANPGDAGDVSLIPGLRRSSLEEEMAIRSRFLPREFHGQRSLVGYSPRGRRELDPEHYLHEAFLLMCSWEGLLDFEKVASTCCGLYLLSGISSSHV